MSDYTLSPREKELLEKLRQEKDSPSADTDVTPMPKGKADTPLPVVSGADQAKQDGYNAIMREPRIRPR